MTSSFIIENLEITDYDILHSNEKNDILEDGDTELYEDNMPIIYYSFPYYSNYNMDYQYKLFFEEDYMVLQEIKSNDMNPNIEDSEVVLKELVRIESTQGLHMISENIDLRDPEFKKKLDICPTWGEVLQLDISKFKKNDAILALENNKIIVLKDLYNHILKLP